MASTAPAPRLGQALRDARLQAGQTLEQVSARTRVRTAVLRDLETGELASSGGQVYARGHVRSVAQALGVDPAPLLQVFDDEAGAPTHVVDHSTPLPLPRAGSLGVPAASAPERTGPRWGEALVAALTVLVALMAVGTFAGQQDRSAGPVDDLLVAPPVTPPAPQTDPTARPLTAAVPPATGARLRVRVLEGSSWIRVQGAEGTLFEGVVASGQAPRDFSDPRELRLLVGNAAALSVVCGGKDVAPAGGEGAVRRFTCSASGLVSA